MMMERLIACLRDSKYAQVRTGSMKGIVALLQHEDLDTLCRQYASELLDAVFSVAGDTNAEMQGSITIAKTRLLRLQKQ